MSASAPTRRRTTKSGTQRRAPRNADPTQFRAMYTRREIGYMEDDLLDVRSHLPRRIALAILTLDADALVACYGENSDALQSLVQQGEDIDGYMACQREFLDTLMTARMRLEFTVQRIIAVHPEFLPRVPQPGDYPEI
ncbi:MAG TPA: hypothetical protein VJ724_13020 [Tahibacter sp.]|nr:hypothetical protein [Tahibacter sp.]